MSSDFRSMRARRIAARHVLLAFALAACGGNDGTAPSSGSGPIRVVAGGNQTDTIEARLRQALVVEVHEANGAIAPGKTVRFSQIYPSASSGERAWVVVSSLTGAVFTVFATDVTDAQGRAKALVRFGAGAGTARLEIAVPELGLVDTVAFTIQPGAAARVSVSPKDSTVLPGATYPLKGSVSDRYSNPIPGVAPTYSAGGVSVSSAGQVTAGSTLARGRIVATYAGAADTAMVSVLPILPMVGNRSGSVYLVSSHATNATLLAATSHSSLAPHSVPATTSVVFYQGGPGNDSKIWVVEPNGAKRTLLPSTTGWEAWPRLSQDGSWVYFVRNDQLWRARLDGSSLDSLATINLNYSRVYRTPTVSPDGKSVAIEDIGGVKVVDVATKTRRNLPVLCGLPRYSPDGTSFACLNGNSLAVMKVDGTGFRTVATLAIDGTGSSQELSGLDWTPDGTAILVFDGSTGRPTLFDVATGASIPLTALGVAVYTQLSFVR